MSGFTVVRPRNTKSTSDRRIHLLPQNLLGCGTEAAAPHGRSVSSPPLPLDENLLRWNQINHLCRGPGGETPHITLLLGAGGSQGHGGGADGGLERSTHVRGICILSHAAGQRSALKLSRTRHKNEPVPCWELCDVTPGVDEKEVTHETKSDRFIKVPSKWICFKFFFSICLVSSSIYLFLTAHTGFLIHNPARITG